MCVFLGFIEEMAMASSSFCRSRASKEEEEEEEVKEEERRCGRGK